MRHTVRTAMIAGALQALWSLTPASAAAGPQANVPGGVIEGEAADDGGAVFRGVPFAAPPVGPLRWRPPQPVQPWSGVRPATTPAPTCAQTAYGDWNAKAAAGGQEDCLYLDVRTPRLDPTARAPVMVWIHGGGNRGGSMEDIVLSSLGRRGVVLVAIQYRLAALGFMSHPALSAESPKHASGNYGLMDQAAALRWVHDNIARFGGDPANVTIFGESAGAQDVGLMMLAPAAKGLFARAIAESGTAGFGMASRSLKEAEGLGDALAVRAGARPGATAAELRALPLAALLQAPETTALPTVVDPSMVWLRTTVDGDILPRPPESLLATSLQAPVPLLIGVNARELSHYGSEPMQAVTRIYSAHSAEAARLYGLKGAVPVDPDPRLGPLAMQIGTDATFRCPASHVADSYARAGAPVWLYQYDVSPKRGPISHAGELVSVFENWPVSPPASATTYSLQDYWLAFARSGSPNAAGLPSWPRHTPAAPAHLSFTDSGPRAVASLRAPFCHLLPSF